MKFQKKRLYFRKVYDWNVIDLYVKFKKNGTFFFFFFWETLHFINNATHLLIKELKLKCRPLCGWCHFICSEFLPSPALVLHTQPSWYHYSRVLLNNKHDIDYVLFKLRIVLRHFCCSILHHLPVMVWSEPGSKSTQDFCHSNATAVAFVECVHVSLLLGFWIYC